jgi:hypothetical protein
MFRFTIRDLVLLTLVVAMGVGWWLDHRRLLQAMRVSELVWGDVVHAREAALQARIDAMAAVQADVHAQPPSRLPK